MVPIVRLVAQLRGLVDGLVEAGRARALLVLLEPRMQAQLEHARCAVRRIDQAAALSEALHRFYQQRPWPVAWAEPQSQAKRFAGPRPQAAAAVLAWVDALERQLSALAAELDAHASSSPLLQPLSDALAPLRATLPQQAAARPSLPRKQKPAELPRRALRGPPSVDLDPAFERSFRLLDGPQPFLYDLTESPGLWCLALREVMAAQLSALLVVEYDGLPLAYYRDFAKQCWDEMRHALFFFECARELLPRFLASAPRDHLLRAGAERFAAEGRGLGVPREGNLYEIAWLATLEERLVLMHLDTERPGVGQIVQQARTPFFRARERLAAGLRLTARDEAFHARIGAAWLQHLLPDRARRQAAIVEARRLRGLYVLCSFSRHDGVPLSELVERVKSGRRLSA
jgi:hypothetical protein